MQEALTITDLQQTRDEVARTLRGNKVSLEYIRLKAFEQTLSNLGHNDPELASHLTTFYLEHRFPRDAQRVLPQLVICCVNAKDIGCRGGWKKWSSMASLNCRHLHAICTKRSLPYKQGSHGLRATGQRKAFSIASHC